MHASKYVQRKMQSRERIDSASCFSESQPSSSMRQIETATITSSGALARSASPDAFCGMHAHRWRGSHAFRGAPHACCDSHVLTSRISYMPCLG